MPTNKEAMGNAIKSRLNGDKNHGWGVDDSTAVIIEIIANENGAKSEDYDKENFCDLIKSLVNPSQFRQALEKAGKLSETKEKRTKSALANLLSEL